MSTDSVQVWELKRMVRKGELIFSIGGEGWGLDAFRIRHREGGWRFYSDGSSISIDENDEDVWTHSRSRHYDSIGDLMDASSIKGWFLIGIVNDLHPEHRNELLMWAEKAYEGLPKDFFDRFPAHSVVTPAQWVDDHTTSKEFLRSRTERSSRLRRSLRRDR